MTSIFAVSIATAGLVFSISVALLVEELIFGIIFRLFFGKRPWIRTKAAAPAAGGSGFEYTEPVAASQWSTAGAGRK